MARFEGAAAHSTQNLQHIARLVSKETYPDNFITPTERKEITEAIQFALTAGDTLNKFLGNAPADAILKCGCAGCEHIKASLSDLRKVAHR